VGRPPALEAQLFTTNAWHTQLLQDLRGAGEVLMSAFSHGEPTLQELFLRRLRDRSTFTLEMIVDAEHCRSRVTRFMRPRLAALVAAGATVKMASGHSHASIFGAAGSGLVGQLHAKAVVLDRSVAYVGSANFTRNSLSNRELVWRVRSPPVMEVLEMIIALRAVSSSFE